MEYTMETTNTCARRIRFILNGNVVTNVQFLDGGCPRKFTSITKASRWNDSRRDRKENWWN